MRMQKVAYELKTALAGEPVEIARQDDTVKVTSSADYMYPPGGWQLHPGAPVLSKMVPTLSRLQKTTIVVNGYTTAHRSVRNCSAWASRTMSTCQPSAPGRRSPISSRRA